MAMKTGQLRVAGGLNNDKACCNIEKMIIFA
jgi:hypothetical protein